MIRKWATLATLAATAGLPLEKGEVALTGAADATPPATVASAWRGSAPCLAPERLGLRTIAARLGRQTAAAPRVSQTVAGFRIEDEAAPLVAALKRLAPARGAAAQATCHKAFCAAQALFGDEAGPRLLYLLVRYGYDGAAGSQPWTPEALDEVLAALGDLPAGLLPLDDTVRTLAHDHELSMLQPDERDPMEDIPMAASGPDLGGIRIGEAWHMAAPPERRASLVHEIAHQFAVTRPAGQGWSRHWIQAMIDDAEWARRTGQPTSQVSLYAERSIDEDFAESATAYRYMPDLLGMRAPHRYALLKAQMFDGLEYHSADQCLPAIALSQQGHVLPGPGGGEGR